MIFQCKIQCTTHNECISSRCANIIIIFVCTVFFPFSRDALMLLWCAVHYYDAHSTYDLLASSVPFSVSFWFIRFALLFYMNKTRRCYKTTTKAQLSHRGWEKTQEKRREIDGKKMQTKPHEAWCSVIEGIHSNRKFKAGMSVETMLNFKWIVEIKQKERKSWAHWKKTNAM